jgi:hypothetical protein
MFFKKKTMNVEPMYINDKNTGAIVGVRVGKNNYRIAAYDLMMTNSPGQKSIYLFNKFGEKVAWDIKSFEELDDMLRKTPNL